MHEKAFEAMEQETEKITAGEALMAMVALIGSFYDHQGRPRPETFAELAHKMLGEADTEKEYRGWRHYVPPALIERLVEAKAKAAKRRREIADQVEEAPMTEMGFGGAIGLVKPGGFLPL